MTIEGEPAKLLLPYLQRADELQKHDHLAAYYCRLYGMEKGLMIPPKERTSETKAILVSLMNQLEKDKKVVKLSADDNLYMEGFALRVFNKADKQDRAGRADLKTAMTFYAASIFFEVLLQFGEFPPDIQEKQKYAIWKAADIRKAIAEGRTPVPGPPVNEENVADGEVDSTWGTEGNANSAPETTQQSSTSPPTDSTFRTTSIDGASHRSYTQPPPSEPPFQHSYSKSSEDFNLPSAPSNPIPPSYNQNSYGAADNAGYPSSAPSHQSSYPHTSGTPFDSLGGNPGPTIGTYSYPSDPPGFTTLPPPSYNSYPPSQQDPSQYHQQQPHWPSSTPFNDPSSAYPSVFPSSGYQPAAPQYPSTPQAPHGASRHSEPPAPVARTSSAPVGPEGPTGYQLNGNYDREYNPSAGTIVEAHKASRFAVSALAFDDVPTAISHLRKSLELLTSPSATVD
ncbi:hypothetical protein KC19_7G118600 [Ceratodon purpureus]|uniref:Uncharacterized protein n=1 Tax=Ceratodon purpureus TaxID=3225 RepID=A0A8T0HAI8_CERPU|nr:hypothetical protein KC19_7G118600 [Ceratodon purpureus]